MSTQRKKVVKKKRKKKQKKVKPTSIGKKILMEGVKHGEFSLTSSGVTDLLRKICNDFNNHSEEAYFPCGIIFSQFLINYYIMVKKTESQINDAKLRHVRKVQSISASHDVKKFSSHIIRVTRRHFGLMENIVKVKRNKAAIGREQGKNVDDPGIYLFLPFFFNLDQMEAISSGDYRMVDGPVGRNHFCLAIVDVLYGQLIFMDSAHLFNYYSIFKDILGSWVNSRVFKETFGTYDTFEESGNWIFNTFKIESQAHQTEPLCPFYLLLYAILYSEPKSVSEIYEDKRCCDKFIKNEFAKEQMAILRKLRK